STTVMLWLTHWQVHSTSGNYLVEAADRVRLRRGVGRPSNPQIPRVRGAPAPSRASAQAEPAFAGTQPSRAGLHRDAAAGATVVAFEPRDWGGGAAAAVRVGAGEATTAMMLSLFRQAPLEQSVLVKPRAVQV